MLNAEYSSFSQSGKTAIFLPPSPPLHSQTLTCSGLSHNCSEMTQPRLEEQFQVRNRVPDAEPDTKRDSRALQRMMLRRGDTMTQTDSQPTKACPLDTLSKVSLSGPKSWSQTFSGWWWRQNKQEKICAWQLCSDIWKWKLMCQWIIPLLSGPLLTGQLQTHRKPHQQENWSQKNPRSNTTACRSSNKHNHKEAMAEATVAYV